MSASSFDLLLCHSVIQLLQSANFHPTLQLEAFYFGKLEYFYNNLHLKAFIFVFAFKSGVDAYCGKQITPALAH